MTVSVRNILDYLGQDALIRLIKLRDVKTSPTLYEKRTTLAHSYQGKIGQLCLDLRRQDLIDILNDGITLKGLEYYIPNLSIMKVDEIRKLAVNIFCHEIKSEKFVPVLEDLSIDLFSTKYSKEDIYSLHEDVLQEALRGTKEIYIASAYYDQTFFEKLFNQSKVHKLNKLYIVFNGLSGQRLKKQKKEIESLFKFLRKYCSKCEIRLKFEQGIFHTKLYIFKGKNYHHFCRFNKFNKFWFNKQRRNSH